MTEHKTADRPDSLRALQTAFAAHLRDPQNQPAPEGVEERRVNIYRQLFFNNINKLLASNFPVIRKILGNRAWRQLVRDFCIEHRCHTPLFPELPREFLRYLENSRDDQSDPPFLLELAHYEWVELALSLDETELEEIEVNREGDLMNEVPLLSPLAWPLTYRYPLHLIGPDFMPTAEPAQLTHLLAYRTADYTVRFMHLNDVTRLLLNLLQESQATTGLELMNEMASKINHPDPLTVIKKGEELLLELRTKGIILGTRLAIKKPTINPETDPVGETHV